MVRRFALHEPVAFIHAVKVVRWRIEQGCSNHNFALADTPRGNGNCTRQVVSYFEVDPNLLPFSPIYFDGNANNDDDVDPYINFCAKLLLYTESGEDQTPVIVTWVDVSNGKCQNRSSH